MWIAHFLKMTNIPFMRLYWKELHKRRLLIQHYVSKLMIYFEFYKKVTQLDIHEDSVIKAFKEMVYSTSKNLSKLNAVIKDMDPNTFAGLAESTKDLAGDFRQALYYPSLKAGQIGVGTVKSEIRSLKGMLLSRNNFPAA